MDKQYLNDEFNRFFEFTTEDKSQVSSVSAKLFAEHIAYPLECELEKQAEGITTLRQRVAELEKERDRLSDLCDKWNFECDELGQDNDRLANEANAMKTAYESAEESVLALKETRNRLAEERDALLEANRIACEDLVERHDRIAELKQQRDELVAALAIAEPVMDAHAGPSRLADFRAAIASVKEKA